MIEHKKTRRHGFPAKPQIVHRKNVTAKRKPERPQVPRAARLLQDYKMADAFAQFGHVAWIWGFTVSRVYSAQSCIWKMMINIEIQGNKNSLAMKSWWNQIVFGAWVPSIPLTPGAVATSTWVIVSQILPVITIQVSKVQSGFNQDVLLWVCHSLPDFCIIDVAPSWRLNSVVFGFQVVIERVIMQCWKAKEQCPLLMHMNISMLPQAKLPETCSIVGSSLQWGHKIRYRMFPSNTMESDSRRFTNTFQPHSFFNSRERLSEGFF